MSKSLDPYQDQRNVGPDLGPNCLQFVLSSAVFFKIDFFKKFLQEHYQSVKQVGSGSGPTLRRS